MTFTSRELQSCAEREAAMRRNVYAKHGMTMKRNAEIEMMQAIADHFKSLAEENTALIGETGDFPQGKLNQHDEGGLQIAIALEGETVTLRFGKQISWIGLPRAEAVQFALVILKRATGAKKLTITDEEPADASDMGSGG